MRSRNDALDVSLFDHELHDEVVMTTQLMVAANGAEGRLSQERVDRVLGLRDAA